MKAHSSARGPPNSPTRPRTRVVARTRACGHHGGMTQSGAMPRRSPGLRTEVRRTDDIVEFVVTTTSALYRQRLIKVGWSSITGESFARRVANTPDLEGVFANFALRLEEMLLQSAGLRPVPWDRALEEFLDRVDGSGLGWWLFGSGALAVRGIGVEPRDLDFAVDDAHHAAALLSDLLVEPPTSRWGWIADWTGRAFHGTLIEWLAGARPTGASPPHEQERERLGVRAWRAGAVALDRGHPLQRGPRRSAHR
jgi:hypothetical protein